MKIMQDAPTFEEFMHHEREHFPTDKVLVQAIAIISVQKGFRDMTPEEVYIMLVEQATEIEEHYG
jgi:hypothetical protein